MNRRILLLFALLPLAALSTAEPGYRLVVNPANPVAALSRADAARLFLKKTAKWPNGWPAQVIDQERSSAVRQAFSRDVHQKEADAVVSFWQTVVFAGRDVPPPIAKSDAEVLAFVRANPGAAGYVSGTTEIAGVKAVPLH
jgi:ABC-type phosphate transport system substrate-binding protein